MASVFLRSVGNSKAPLFFLVFSACLNVGLDLLLIIQFGMGVAGAALATVVSQGLSVLLCLVYILKKSRYWCRRNRTGDCTGMRPGNSSGWGCPWLSSFPSPPPGS